MDNKKISSKLFTIGTVAKSFGVSENTIRRMETAGLLTPAEIRESGYRYYDYDNISRIKMILAFRSVGLVYDDMRQYFRNPGDFSGLYNKLLAKKILMDTIIERASNYVKPDVPGEIYVSDHPDICLFKKVFRTEEPLSVEAMEEYAVDILSEAISKKYPIDYKRPVSIFTECMKYDEFNPYDNQVLTFGIALRETVDAPDTMILPASTVLTFSWYKDASFAYALSNLARIMAENGLEQSAPIGATFEIGKHLDKEIDNNNFLFHIIVPCRKV